MISGTDVEALFPSLRDVESARIVREAVIKSEADIENFDCNAALKYLYIVGGPAHLKEIGLGKISPRWTGPRPDLLSVGGECGHSDQKWFFPRKNYTNKEEKVIASRVLELAVLVCMGTHAYSFCGHLYLQREGGPIGMRFTASLANLVMKMWDCYFTNLAIESGIKILLYVRYVDDCRVFLRGVKRGWIWERGRVSFSDHEFENDGTSREHTIKRTTRLLTGMMCSLAENLKFTGEDSTQFCDNTLPTLDTALWVQDGLVQYKFYEKPTVGNQVLHKDTALPVSCIRASLMQDTVRRLLNCSRSVEQRVRTRVLDDVASKLVNSGHSPQSARIILVHGVTKYLHKVKLSELQTDDPEFRPLYFGKDYREDERQCDKYMAKMSWYKSKENARVDKDRSKKKKECWKNNLQGVWKGSTRSQRRVKGMDFSTILQVLNTRNSVLLNNLVKAEDQLALMSGYNVKMVEQSGIQLSRLFPGVPSSSSKCHWTSCPVCREHTGKGSSGCRTSNLVYEAVCVNCLEEVERGTKKECEVGKYIGESGRTLAERSVEHDKGAKSFDPDNFIIKHWVLHHQDLRERPRVKFKVKKSFRDPLSRLIAESVIIDLESNLNSKSEWRSNKMTRLVVEAPTWLSDRGRRGREKREKRATELSVDDDLSELIETLKMKKTTEDKSKKTDLSNEKEEDGSDMSNNEEIEDGGGDQHITIPGGSDHKTGNTTAEDKHKAAGIVKYQKRPYGGDEDHTSQRRGSSAKRIRTCGTGR